LGFLGVGRRKDLRVDDDVYDDIIDVPGRGVLGLSIGCARCHDHKLEPVTTRDYYGLYTVLRSSKEPEVLPALPQADTDQTREFAAKNRAARAGYIRVIAFEADRSLGAVRCRIGDYLLAAKDAGLQTIYQGKTIKAEVLDPRRLHTAPPLPAGARMGEMGEKTPGSVDAVAGTFRAGGRRSGPRTRD
jgi:hypothetical protein